MKRMRRLPCVLHPPPAINRLHPVHLKGVVETSEAESRLRAQRSRHDSRGSSWRGIWPRHDSRVSSWHGIRPRCGDGWPIAALMPAPREAQRCRVAVLQGVKRLGIWWWERRVDATRVHAAGQSTTIDWHACRYAELQGRKRARCICPCWARTGASLVRPPLHPHAPTDLLERLEACAHHVSTDSAAGRWHSAREERAADGGTVAQRLGIQQARGRGRNTMRCGVDRDASSVATQ